MLEKTNNSLDELKFKDKKPIKLEFSPTKDAKKKIAFNGDAELDFSLMFYAIKEAAIIATRSYVDKEDETSLFGYSWFVNFCVFHVVSKFFTDMKSPEDITISWKLFVNSDLPDVLKENIPAYKYVEGGTFEAVENIKAQKRSVSPLSSIVDRVGSFFDAVKSKVDESTLSELVESISAVAPDAFDSLKNVANKEG